MNDYFAVEPAEYENWRELKMILDHFGPYHGRYVVAYPPSWKESILDKIKNWKELDRKRAVEALSKLIKRRGLMRNLGHNYDIKKTWQENVLDVLTKDHLKPFKGAVVCTEPSSEFFTAAEDLSLPPTADERIDATPEEYGRVCEAILKFSDFVILIDPYLDICKQDRKVVIESLLHRTAKGSCKEFKIFVRNELMQSSVREIRLTAGRLMKNSEGSVRKISYNLCHDKNSNVPMHARYLLSSYGGIRLDQGFQRLNRKIDVSVVGETTRNSLWEDFSRNKPPFPISETIDVSV